MLKTAFFGTHLTTILSALQIETVELELEQDSLLLAETDTSVQSNHIEKVEDGKLKSTEFVMTHFENAREQVENHARFWRICYGHN